MPGGPEDIVVLAKVVEELYKQANNSGGTDALVAALRRRQHVLMMGATGVGKSNLLDSLKTDTPVAIDLANRTELLEKRRIRFGPRPLLFHDTPGDELRKPQRQIAWRQHLRQRRPIIINVVAFGYHEYRKGLDEHPLRRNHASPAFLTAHQAVELDMVREWVGFLDPTQTKYLITVVSKADLWYDRQLEVLKHYEDGAYGRLLVESGWRNRTVVDYSSVFHKFYGEGQMSGLFGDDARQKAKAHLVKLLLQMCLTG